MRPASGVGAHALEPGLGPGERARARPDARGLRALGSWSRARMRILPVGRKASVQRKYAALTKRASHGGPRAHAIQRAQMDRESLFGSEGEGAERKGPEPRIAGCTPPRAAKNPSRPSEIPRIRARFAPALGLDPT